MKAETAGKQDIFENDELLALARLDLERGDSESALRKLKQVLADKAAPSEAVTMAASLYARLGLFERSRILYQRHLASHPGSLLESFQLGMTYLDGGQPREAVAIWEKVLKEHPTHPPALFYMALVLAQEGKATDARHALDILLKSAAPDNLYFTRGKELLQSIETGKVPKLDRSGNGSTRSIPADAYKTEH